MSTKNKKYTKEQDEERYKIIKVEKSGNRNTYTSLMAEAKEIADNYHVRLSIKTREDFVDQRQTFLFHDGSFHTVFSLLREINLFLLHFRLFSIEWAKNYMVIVNSSRNDITDAMNLENAISSILKRLELTNRQRDLLMGETCQIVRNHNDLILEDRSFYQVGMEYYEFEDNDSHHDNTNLKFVKVYDTPEKIMLYLTGKATVFGISATAEVDTVVGNYDLRYLKV